MTYPYVLFTLVVLIVLCGVYFSFLHTARNKPFATATLPQTTNVISANEMIVPAATSSPDSDTQRNVSIRAAANNQNAPQGSASAPLVPAPELSGITGYINTDSSLTMASLRGKVVVVFFWTYSCINCERTVPYVEALYEKYKDRRLVVIGIHTPELANERVFANVQQAVKDQGITFPVVMDSDYSTWRSYNNEYWPNRYVIDKEGNIQYSSAGEGNQDTIEKVVQLLLTQA